MSVRIVYRKTGAALKWKSIGEICVPGMGPKGEIHKTDAESRAAQLAEQL